MAFKQENEKVAKLTRAIIDGTGRRIEHSTLSKVYPDEKLGPAYRKWHYNILTDFQPGAEMQRMIIHLLLLFKLHIDIDSYEPWLMYYGYKTTLLADKIGGLTNISKVAFMEQEKKEENIGDTSKWQLFEKDSS